MVDYVMVMLAGAAKHTQAKLVIGTEDMVDTGKFHCWIAKSVISITGACNPHTRQVELFELFGQPFGAAAAVLFYRLAGLLSRAYRLLLGHFFDDFFVVLREAEAQKPLCSSSASLLSSLG